MQTEVQKEILSEAALKSESLVQHYLLHEAQNHHQQLMPSMIERKHRVPRSLRRPSLSAAELLSGGGRGMLSQEKARKHLAKKATKEEKKKKKKKKSSKRSRSVDSKSSSSSGSTASSMSEYTAPETNSPIGFVLVEMTKAAPDGSSPRTFPSLEMNEVFSEWTAEQHAAYDKDAIRCIRGRDIETMRKWHEEGRTLQAANSFGESLLHMACRRGFKDVVEFLMEECHHELWIRDDTGRTPMHDACWTPTPNPDLVDFLLSKDPDMLLVTDKRGHTPLDYARKEHWEFWIEHFKKKNMLSLLPKRHFFMTNKENAIMLETDQAVVENLGLMISQLEMENAANTKSSSSPESAKKTRKKSSRSRGKLGRRSSESASSVDGSVKSVRSGRSRGSLLSFGSRSKEQQ